MPSSGDCQTAALVARDGSIDWLCLPRFDSGACFAALLGTPEHGRWQIAPAGEVRRVRRQYRPGTLVLETVFETDEGEVAVIDFMPPRTEAPELIRVVEGRRGRVPMRMELIIRFDYGVDRPLGAAARARHLGRRRARPPAASARMSSCAASITGPTADFEVAEGQREVFDLVWHPAHEPEPRAFDAAAGPR